MELLKIDNDKLKITLTKEDMEKYALDFDKFSYDNTETRRAFWTILDDAKHETGFDAAVDTVSVQVYGSGSGGCEMYVTRVSDREKEEENIGLPILSRNVGQSIYGFHRIEDLLSACRLLDSLHFTGSSSAYFDQSGYYLQLTDGMYGRLKKSDLLSEFGTALDPGFSSYISEHGITLCKGHAVGLLSALASSEG
ncbi:MAG: adaptor protein MecA [Eubacteriales bacterium]